MGEHETSVGKTSEWYTPPEIFAALGLEFDLDPCSPADRTHCAVPAKNFYTEADDGLNQPWKGLIFMNPPFGGRNGQVPWLEKFFTHGNGVGVVPAWTSAKWFHNYIFKYAEFILFPLGKTAYIAQDGVRGKSPGFGSVLFSIGERGNKALMRAKLGWVLEVTDDYV